MRQRLAVVVLLLVLGAPAYGQAQGPYGVARYRLDCESGASWLGHVRAAVVRLVRASISVGLAQDLRTIATDGSLSADDIGGSLTVIGQTVALHLSPVAVLDLAAATVCIVRTDDGVE